MYYPVIRYNNTVIENIRGKLTQDIFDGVSSKAARKLPVHLHERAQDLLDSLNAIVSPEDSKSPPGNKLHKLKGELKDFWSISINDQWRIIFRFAEGKALDVEIIDYH